MSYVKIGVASKILGVNAQTLRNWSNEGKINTTTTPTGHRLYSVESLNSLLGIEKEVKQAEKQKIFIYARVSTKKQEQSGNLERQIGRLTQYAQQNGYEIAGIYKDVASGINEKRKELKKLLEDVSKHPNSFVLVEYKDRLARFGFAYLEKYINDFGSTVKVLDSVEKNEEQELVDDLISITTSFSARIYGKRGGKKVIQEVQNILENSGINDQNLNIM